MIRSPESEPFLVRWTGKLGSIFGLSVMWILCCLPVLTIMPACIALYDSVVNCLHGNEPSPIRRFFSTLRRELLRGIGLSVLWIVVWVVFLYGFALVNNIGKEIPAFSMYSVLYAGSSLIPMTMMLWVIPLQARFNYGFFELHRMAMTFVIVHLPTTAAILGMLIVTVVLSFFLLPLILLIPAILVALQSHLTEKVLVLYEIEEGIE